jgi:hypothetical protein
VRAVGEHPGVIYLSVSPHVEPTHTQYDADGQTLPPKYGVWQAAGGGEPRSELPSSTLLERYRAAAQALAKLAQANASTVDTATTSEDIKKTVDQLWAGLKPVLLQVEALEREWNELALCAAD